MFRPRLHTENSSSRKNKSVPDLNLFQIFLFLFLGGLAVKSNISAGSWRGLKDNAGQDQEAEDQEGRRDDQQF